MRGKDTNLEKDLLWSMSMDNNSITGKMGDIQRDVGILFGMKESNMKRWRALSSCFQSTQLLTRQSVEIKNHTYKIEPPCKPSFLLSSYTIFSRFLLQVVRVVSPRLAFHRYEAPIMGLPRSSIALPLSRHCESLRCLAFGPQLDNAHAPARCRGRSDGSYLYQEDGGYR